MFGWLERRFQLKYNYTLPNTAKLSNRVTVAEFMIQPLTPPIVYCYIQHCLSVRPPLSFIHRGIAIRPMFISESASPAYKRAITLKVAQHNRT